jgi:hypothetical protein
MRVSEFEVNDKTFLYIFKPLIPRLSSRLMNSVHTVCRFEAATNRSYCQQYYFLRGPLLPWDCYAIHAIHAIDIPLL